MCKKAKQYAVATLNEDQKTVRRELTHHRNLSSALRGRDSANKARRHKGDLGVFHHGARVA